MPAAGRPQRKQQQRRNVQIPAGGGAAAQAPGPCRQDAEERLPPTADAAVTLGHHDVPDCPAAQPPVSEPGGALPPWEKVLWRCQPYDDNYVDASFLQEMVRWCGGGGGGTWVAVAGQGDPPGS